MIGRTLGLSLAAALLLSGSALAQSPPTDPDRPSTPGKLPPTRTAPVMGGTVRNGNGATSEDAAATMGQSTDVTARSAEARRHHCERHPPAVNDEKGRRTCEAVGATAPH